MWNSFITFAFLLLPLTGDEAVYNFSGMMQALQGGEPLNNSRLDFAATIDLRMSPVEQQPGFARYDFEEGMGRFTITESGPFDDCYEFPGPAELYVYNNYFGIDGVSIGGRFPSGFVEGTNSDIFFFNFIDSTAMALSDTSIPTILNLEDFDQNDSYMGEFVSGGLPIRHYLISVLDSAISLESPCDADRDGDVDYDDFQFTLANFCFPSPQACFFSRPVPDLRADYTHDCHVVLDDIAKFFNAFTDD